MAAASESVKDGETNPSTKELLKSFYQRASDAESIDVLLSLDGCFMRAVLDSMRDRLSRLESALASNKDARNEELLMTISELQEKLGAANGDLASEREKVVKLADENAKLRYRINHLVRAVRLGDAKLEQMTGEKFLKFSVSISNSIAPFLPS
ncbi:hypothetical protein Tsubulata_020486 [Turnera subulata]|uniref:Uncharacterized protein n=1 Tax=Turnera subulata TaxID=218843 RepID=A0A9Q0F5V3_9ROSI|nr:hypothetical protein Tsubulata_020486 [Turnera subulata]